MQASILIRNSLLKKTAEETLLPCMYDYHQVSSVRAGKDTLLNKSKGGEGGINS